MHLVQVEGAGAHEGHGVAQVIAVHAVLVVLEGHHAEGKGYFIYCYPDFLRMLSNISFFPNYPFHLLPRASLILASTH